MKKLLIIHILLAMPLLAWCDNITFADEEVKAICVKNWDTDGDGELSKAEAAAVKDLGEAFYSNTNIKSFDELQYFTGLTNIDYPGFFYCTVTSITIPTSVASIGESAFGCCFALTSITIPSSVTSIGEGAFRSSGLTSITIPSSVTSIGEGAFRSCSGLTSIKVDSGNKYYDSRDASNAIIETKNNTLIAGCKNTIIPNTVTSIGSYAFQGSQFTNITIPSSVTSIGEHAFSSSGLTSITIPSSVTSIGEGAFRSCSGLTSIKVDSGNKYYDSRDASNAIIETKNNTLIAGCKNTIIPNTVTSIGSYAFQGSQFTNITIPSSVTSIGEHAFSSSGLTSITIPSSVTLIGDYAFSTCLRLTSITIPSSVTSIGDYAFYGCI